VRREHRSRELRRLPAPGQFLTPIIPSRASILRLAWPIILANAAEPLLGLSDTAVIGNVGTTAELGAIGLGALVLNFVFWTFGFLRMATTGFTAQAVGAGDEAEVRATLARSLLFALGIGAALLVLQWPIGALAIGALSGSAEVELLARRYFEIRIWGAPAVLGTFALMGCFIGLGQTRLLLAVQLLLNGLNVALDVWFAGVLGWGVEGIALGTVIAEWLALGMGGLLAWTALSARHADAAPFWTWASVWESRRVARALVAQLDIMLRTLYMLLGLGWFMDRSAQLGDVTLAANHVLLQLIGFSAFVLDGFAFVAESQVGAALGAHSRRAFRHAVVRTSELAALAAALLALAIWGLGELAARALTDLEPVRALVAKCMPLSALYVLVGVAAFQLDGVFIGATRTREMRNASAVSVAVFLGMSALLTRWYGNTGLWVAFIAYVITRALSLGRYYPRLERSVG
jgi:MATE family multidrug resistance protein